MPPVDPALRRWWPTTQSIDLVEGSISGVAAAVADEFARFAGETVTTERRNCRDLDETFGGFLEFNNIPTAAVLLPTRSRWTAIWYNTFLCDGYDSLCHCLTSRHSLTTIHWSAHDEWTTFQSGSTFSYRRLDGAKLVHRVVHAIQEDSKWTFVETGEPLAEEDLTGYSARKKRDRLNEKRVMELLARLGAEPWVEIFYALPGEVITVSRPPPSATSWRKRDDVLLPAPANR